MFISVAELFAALQFAANLSTFTNTDLKSLASSSQEKRTEALVFPKGGYKQNHGVNKRTQSSLWEGIEHQVLWPLENEFCLFHFSSSALQK